MKTFLTIVMIVLTATLAVGAFIIALNAKQ